MRIVGLGEGKRQVVFLMARWVGVGCRGYSLAFAVQPGCCAEVKGDIPAAIIVKGTVNSQRCIRGFASIWLGTT